MNHFLLPHHRFASFSSEPNHTQIPETDNSIVLLCIASAFNLRCTLPLTFPDFQCSNSFVFDPKPHHCCSNRSHLLFKHFCVALCSLAFFFCDLRGPIETGFLIGSCSTLNLRRACL